MNPLDHRRMLGELAQQMEARRALTDEQYDYLAKAFRRIADGEDAGRVLSVSFARGQKESDALARQRLSLVLHWVACAIAPTDGDLPGLGLTLDAACEQATAVARVLSGDKDSEQYDASYIKKCWHALDKRHMQLPERNSFNSDFPY